MSDESYVARLEQEDFTQHEEKLRAWAISLDTTPERLKEAMCGDPASAKQVRDLLGIH